MYRSFDCALNKYRFFFFAIKVHIRTGIPWYATKMSREWEVFNFIRTQVSVIYEAYGTKKPHICYNM